MTTENGATGGIAANQLARDADLVIAVGTRLGDFTTMSKTTVSCAGVSDDDVARMHRRTAGNPFFVRELTRLGQLRGDSGRPWGTVELVDYAGVAQAKLEVLEILFNETRTKGKPGRFAVFEALREKFGGGWQSWPQEYRKPGSAAVKRSPQI